MEWKPGARYRLLVMAVFGCVVVLTGGASRYDEDQQLLVRLAAVVAIAATLWPLDLSPLRGRGRLIAAIGAAYLLALAQLVPLPPDLWARLPGHAVYAQIAEAAGAVGWRPLSMTPDLTVNTLYALLPATAAALCAIYLDARGRVRIAEGVVAAACVSGGLGFLQLASGGEGLRLFRESSLDSAVGLFANRNHQAAFLACALPFVGALSASRVSMGADRRVIAAVAAPVTVFLILALLVTLSRMGLLLGLVGFVGAAASWRAGGQPLLPSTPRARLVAGAGVAALAVAIGAVADQSGVFARFTTPDPAGEMRLATLGPMLTTMQSFMPWGAGFGSFETVYRQFEPDALLSSIYMNQAHNEPLQLAIEGGVPALVLLGVFCWWWATTAGRVARIKAPRRVMNIAAIAVTAILMLSSLVDYPLRTPLLSALFAFACMEMASSARRADAAAGGVS